MSEAQHYNPYRASLLSREQLRTLTQLRPALAIRDTLIGWLWIFAAWVAVALYPNVLVVALAVIVIGTSYYALAIVGHDGLHRRLFESAEHSDLWNDLFIMGPIGAITRINRANHMEHHRATCLPHDPDRHKYLHDHKEGTLNFAFFLSGLQSLYPSLANIFVLSGQKAEATQSKERYHARDFAILLGWQVALIAGLTYWIGWWAYPVLWLLPVYLFAYRADLVRVFCEHAMLMSDPEADEHRRMITYTSNWLERRFFAPHNMNFHAAHHLWPSIPYYNLPEADRLIRNWVARKGGDENLIWRRSYFGFIVSYWRWWRRQSEPVPTLG
ncbi:MAG: fatty acid desaturase [Hyphomicrobiales bacterium]|nr:fatty acid desaturase [Hyphomicrobiales bacterium]MBV8825557.1 fatty acid desaturase [Hyphomicrobiales bacterium]MBV9430122.1 fatty acid desaturase [Bradyrhizobiaceae bacterium]